jgi:hypothetical protein
MHGDVESAARQIRSEVFAEIAESDEAVAHRFSGFPKR